MAGTAGASRPTRTNGLDREPFGNRRGFVQRCFLMRAWKEQDPCHLGGAMATASADGSARCRRRRPFARSEGGEAPSQAQSF